jgi:drug/metabolite transporter (DMT)-like permease
VVEEPPAASARKPQVPAAALSPGMVPVGRVVAVGAFAAGAAALLLAGVYGLMASSDHAVFRSTYDPGERPAAAARVRTESLAADVSLGLGLGLGLAGAASWALSPGGP